MKKRFAKSWLAAGLAAVLVCGMAPLAQAGSPASGASGTDLLGISQSFKVWFDDVDTYTLYDPSFLDLSGMEELNTGIEIEATGETVIYSDASADNNLLEYFTSSDLTSGWDLAAVSGISNTYAAVNYFKDTFARNGLDDANMNNLLITGFKEDPNAAFWNGSFAVFGEGDGVAFNSLVGCQDVVAHVLSQGVIDHTANLKNEFQSGALRLALADIFAVMVDDTNWTIGEDCTLADPKYLRSLFSPFSGVQSRADQMDKYRSPSFSDDRGDVTYNSGIPSRAAYLMAEGLEDEGLSSITRAKTAQVFYRAMTQLLLPNAQFIDARRETLQAAADLYGPVSAEVTAVGQAWDEVGVLDDDSVPGSTVPTLAAENTGDDVFVYLRTASGGYDLHLQNQTTPADNKALVHTQKAKLQRPMVVTTTVGEDEVTYVYFVGADSNIHRLNLNASTELRLSNSGDVASIAVSPDNQTLAFVSNSDLAAINIIDLSESIDTVVATHPVLATAENLEAEIGSMAFDYSSRQLVFDVAFCQSLPGDTCPTGGYQYHGVRVMDMETGLVDKPMPDQPVNVAIANPTFAANSPHVLVMDWLDSRVNGVVTSKVISYNTLAIGANKMQTVIDLGTGPTAVEGIPSFWGGDDYVTFQQEDSGVVSTYRVPLNSDWSGDSATKARLSFLESLYPAMHRASPRDLTPSVTLSSTDLQFGVVLVGDSAELSVEITNTGPVDVEIETISITHITNAFSHDGGYSFLPRGESITLGLSYQASNDLLRDIGTLNINLRGGETAEATMQADVMTAARLFTNFSVLDYGDVEFGASAGMQLRITNTGTQMAEINSISSSNAAFTFVFADNENSIDDLITNSALALVPGATDLDKPGKRFLDVTYTAGLTETTDVGTLTITYNDGETTTVGLNANTVAPPVPAELEATPVALSFGQVEAWSVTELPLVIRNVGTSATTVTTGGFSDGPFFFILDEDKAFSEEDPDNDIDLAGESEATISVSFSADATAGIKTGVISLAYGDGQLLEIPMSAEVLPAPERQEKEHGGIASSSLLGLLFMMLVLLSRRAFSR